MSDALDALLGEGWTLVKLFTRPCDGIYDTNEVVTARARDRKVPIQLSRITGGDLARLSVLGCEALVVAGYPWLVRGWREGRLGALRMGAEHGLFCVGCCWGLMLALFALGVMSLFWMAVAAAVIFAEKVLPQGPRLTRALAAALVALGLLVALSPGRVPALTQPAPMEMSP